MKIVDRGVNKKSHIIQDGGNVNFEWYVKLE